jgi:hypothetical protein
MRCHLAIDEKSASNRKHRALCANVMNEIMHPITRTRDLKCLRVMF